MSLNTHGLNKKDTQLIYFERNVNKLKFEINLQRFNIKVTIFF